jgi:hypothetical protein
MGTSWDGPAAVAGAPNEAPALKSMFAWRDPNMDPTRKGAYKLPHHETPGAPANLNGVRNALARLPQSNIPVAEQSAVKAHLDAHLAAEQKTSSTK